MMPLLDLPGDEKIENLCSIFRLISNQNRLRILLMLSEGEYSVGDIEGALLIKQPNLSQELRNLRDSGFVRTRKESKVVFYSTVNNEQMDLVLAHCRSHLGHKPVKHNIHPFHIESSQPSMGECGHFASVSFLK